MPASLNLCQQPCDPVLPLMCSKEKNHCREGDHTHSHQGTQSATLWPCGCGAQLDDDME
jgi:hypothetical protein